MDLLGLGFDSDTPTNNLTTNSHNSKGNSFRDLDDIFKTGGDSNSAEVVNNKNKADVLFDLFGSENATTSKSEVLNFTQSLAYLSCKNVLDCTHPKMFLSELL